MDNRSPSPIQPDYAIPPGATLRETLRHLGMSQAALAERTGRPKKTINEIIKGKVALTPETAIQLERVLGVPASFWNNLECQYRENLARLEEASRLNEHLDWMKRFPIREMVNLGWIKATGSKLEQLQELLNFFGVANPANWNEVWQSMPVAFRKSPAYKADPYAVAAWLRSGELASQQIECEPFSVTGFRETLDQIRRMTVEPPEVFCPKLKRLTAASGVAVVFVRELPRIRASGATRWITPGKAVIQLSLRYKTDDHLWFTFFHEAGHILLHGKTDVFLEGMDQKNEKEEEANRFATAYLIPPDVLRGFIAADDTSRDAIRSFAGRLGIAPGIVVGQLQHADHLPHSRLNDLKRHLEWA